PSTDFGMILSCHDSVIFGRGFGALCSFAAIHVIFHLRSPISHLPSSVIRSQNIIVFEDNAWGISFGWIGIVFLRGIGAAFDADDGANGSFGDDLVIGTQAEIRAVVHDGTFGGL